MSALFQGHIIHNERANFAPSPYIHCHYFSTTRPYATSAHTTTSAQRWGAIQRSTCPYRRQPDSVPNRLHPNRQGDMGEADVYDFTGQQSAAFHDRFCCLRSRQLESQAYACHDLELTQLSPSHPRMRYTPCCSGTTVRGPRSSRRTCSSSRLWTEWPCKVWPVQGLYQSLVYVGRGWQQMEM
jgi:hypothetical protein